jgi:hypothetical protein
MIRGIPIDTEIASQIKTVELGGKEYRIRFEWRDKIGGWYASLYRGEADPDPVQLNVRLVSNQPLFDKALDSEDGVFSVIGPNEEYDRYDFNDSYKVIWLSLDEFEGV